MIILDTDTLSLFHAGHELVTERMSKVDLDVIVATTVITKAEILRARFSFLLKAADGERLQRAQDWLDRTEALLADLAIVGVDAKTAFVFDDLRERKKLKKIGHADLLIAAMTLANDATLVTLLRTVEADLLARVRRWADGTQKERAREHKNVIVVVWHLDRMRFAWFIRFETARTRCA
jgi:tRNA(fMet)-specific endonuclease VapC